MLTRLYTEVLRPCATQLTGIRIDTVSDLDDVPKKLAVNRATEDGREVPLANTSTPCACIPPSSPTVTFPGSSKW